MAALTPEGIHPNIWGEAFLARELLRGAGLAPLVANPGPYLDLLTANASRLSLTGKPLDADTTRAFIQTWLAP